MNKEFKIREGLKPLKKDSRDFVLGAIFLPIRIEEVPDDFIIAEPIKVKDQKISDYCTGFASAAVSEDQEGVELDPLYAFAKIKQIQGEWQNWGADLRSTCKAAVKFGFLEQKDALYNIDNLREVIANWNTYSPELNEKAKIHSKQSYFSVSSLGHKDLFDGIRASIWQHRREKRSVLTGTLWKNEWTFAPDGIIPKEPGTPSFGHAFKFFGQKKINEGLYLMAQLSNGEEQGDRGIFYFPREVINRDFTFGNFMFKDINPEVVKVLTWSIWQQEWEKLRKCLKNKWDMILD